MIFLFCYDFPCTKITSFKKITESLMLSKREAVETLKRRKLKFPPFQFQLVSIEEGQSVFNLRPDWLLDVSWRNETRRFAVEYLRDATPKRLREAQREVPATGSYYTPLALADPNIGDTIFPMIMAPFLSEEKLEELAEQEVSAIDLCGNGVVIVPGQWFVFRTGKPNKYRSSAPIRNVYKGQSSLVGRILLERPRFEKLKDIAAEIRARGGELSLGTISKVLKALGEDLVATKDEGIRVVQKEKLLDLLGKNYQGPRDLRRVRGRLPERADMLRTLTSDAQALKTRIAVSGIEYWARMPSSDSSPPVYVESLETLGTQVGFEEGGLFTNVEFRETRDSLVYFDTRDIDGVKWTSPVQTYLDLANGGKREREVAEDLRRRILGGDLA